MKDGEGGWESDFPIREQVEDYAGRMRSFTIDCHPAGLGFTVRATEDGRRGLGYEFAAYSETSPDSALYRVRQKLRRGLATRHVTRSSGQYQMLHDQVSGRITSDGDRGLILVVDGIPIGLEELGSILGSYEGWGFELRIVDALE